MKTFTRIWLGIGLCAIVFGLGLLILALVTRTDEDIYTPVYSIDKSYYDVDQLYIDIAYGKVEIVEGKGFRIQGENLLDEKLETYVQDGTWHIKDSRKSIFSIWDIDLSFNNILRNRKYKPQITITIPEGFIAESFTLMVRAGEVKADTILANKGDFSVEAGYLEIDKLQVPEASKYQVGAGKMRIKQILANDINVNCGVGEVHIDGWITGKSKIQTNVGNVILNLAGKWEDYSYDIDNSIGNVTIGKERISGLGKQRTINNKLAENRLIIKCDVGNISIDFME